LKFQYLGIILSFQAHPNISISFQCLRFIPTSLQPFGWALIWGLPAFKKNAPKNFTAPLLKKFRLTLAHPLKSSKEQNFGFQSLFDQLDSDILFLIKKIVEIYNF
jgi:hypothetical protein